MPRNLADSPLMKPFVVLALPGMYLFYKYSQYKQQQQEQCRRKVTERELAHLNHKIDKLLTKLEENEPELATSQEDECVICVNARATMQTSPCGHRVVCRKCFVKTIQMAVSQRLLPLRCVICRAKILRLKQSSGRSWLPASASQYSMRSAWSRSPWGPGSVGTRSVPPSASQYSMGARSVPASASMYSMTSGSSSLSGMSSVSSATNSSTNSKSSSSSFSGSSRQGVRQPTGSLKRSQQYSMKVRIQEYNEPRGSDEGEKHPRLPPIVEFQREYRLGRERAGSSSTRIRCAQNILTQLETVPLLAEKPPIRRPPSTPTKTLHTPLRTPVDKTKETAEPVCRKNVKSVDSLVQTSKLEVKSEKKETKKDEPVKSEKEEKKEAKAARKVAKKEAKKKAKNEAKEKKEVKEREKREAKEKDAREKREAKEKKEGKNEGKESKTEKKETNL